MTKNHFVFADLSTYELKTAQQFYANVFDWEYVTEDDQYHLATYHGKEISGLYETPQKFKDMNMPSFWMGYIQVENVQETVSKAKALGGIIELVDTENAIGGIALIRDPLGAGFTVYEGNQLASRYENAENALVWNELFISDLKKVQPFYEGIFNWTISPDNNHRHFILDSQKKRIGAIQEVSNELKGKYEYWGVFFAVDNVAATKQRVLQNGGSLVFEDENFTALADPFGAFFHVVPLEKNGTIPKKNRSKKSFKWKALLGLALILVYFITGWPWIWALFFAFWVYMDLRSGHTHLFEPVQKKQNPLLYWVVVAMWAFLGVYSVLYYIDPQWFYSQADYYQPTQKRGQIALNSKEIAEAPAFKTITLSEQHFVGITTQLSGNQKDDKAYIDELWGYFLDNDIASVIPHISGSEVYLVYIDHNDDLNTYTKALLGYRVSKIGELYDGLELTTVPKGSFAQFDSHKDSDTFLTRTWEEISKSNHIWKNNDALEVYFFNGKNELTKTELYIALSD